MKSGMGVGFWLRWVVVKSFDVRIIGEVMMNVGRCFEGEDVCVVVEEVVLLVIVLMCVLNKNIILLLDEK